jgi:hypothetical protein
MKIFKAIFFAVIAALVLFGLVLPNLISNKSDVSVIVGFTIIAILVYYGVSAVINLIKENL